MNSAEAFAAIALAAVLDAPSNGMKPMPGAQLEYRSCTAAALKLIWDGLTDCSTASEIRVSTAWWMRPACSDLAQQQSALAVAAHLAHADRTVTTEDPFLESLSKQMVLPEGEAASILVAIEALNRDSLDA